MGVSANPTFVPGSMIQIGYFRFIIPFTFNFGIFGSRERLHSLQSISQNCQSRRHLQQEDRGRGQINYTRKAKVFEANAKLKTGILKGYGIRFKSITNSKY